MSWHDTTFWAWVFFLSEWAIRVIMLAVVPFRPWEIVTLRVDAG